MSSEAMKTVQFLGLFLILLLHSATMAATPRKPVSVPFHKNYLASWGADHIKQFHGGLKTKLLLNKQYGAGFESKGTYLFGHFSMQIKLVPGDSTGTVTAFYLSSQTAEHDDINFEFLGNKSTKPYILQTNVFTGGKGEREHRIYLWFDPTKDYHSYAVLWNMYQIVFLLRLRTAWFLQSSDSSCSKSSQSRPAKKYKKTHSKKAQDGSQPRRCSHFLVQKPSVESLNLGTKDARVRQRAREMSEAALKAVSEDEDGKKGASVCAMEDMIRELTIGYQA